MQVDWLTVSALVAFAGLLGAIGRDLAVAFYARGKKDESTDGTKALADTVRLEMKELSTTLHQHMIDDAAALAKLETIVGDHGRAQVAAENRMAGAIEGFGRELGEVTKRIDRLFEIRTAD